MKIVILAGGLGTRLSEETLVKPKPMVEIGGKPILWHIMKIYSYYGFNDFIVCCGYKGYIIKEYFANYFLHSSDVTFDLVDNKVITHSQNSEPWKVTLIDTGENTMTGGRLKRIQNYIEKDDNFCFTYGDGLADINIKKLVDYHLNHKKLATVTSVQPPGRFGAVNVGDNNIVKSFNEKPKGDGSLINGGFFVLNKSALDYIDNDTSVWEKEPLEILAAKEELIAYKHDSFWCAMDTLRDKNYLNDLWYQRKAPWKVWNE